MQTLKYTGLHPVNITYKTKDDKGFYVKRNLSLAKGDSVYLDENLPLIKSFVSRGLLVNSGTPAQQEDKPIQKNSKK